MGTATTNAGLIMHAAASDAPDAAAARDPARVASHHETTMNATPNCRVFGSSPWNAGMAANRANVTVASAPADRPA